jgi:hypothetical protein
VPTKPEDIGALPASSVVAPSPSATAGQAADAKATGDALEPMLFAQYYPDGAVKSAAEFTPGIEYNDPDTTNRTITVKPFCNTGTAANNSSLSGRVVIPPFVDGDDNPFISDDGTRFKVVGVSSGYIYAPNADLTAIVAPSTVTSIEAYAFVNCTSLASVSLPAATSIGIGAFYGCTSLASVSLPAATSIEAYAFAGCTSLASVSLPAATRIEASYAFRSCTSLASVDFGDTPRLSVPSLGSGAFNSVPTSCKIIVPYTQYDAWTAASGWSSLQQEFVRHAEKADKPATFTEGNLAEFDSNGNLVDSGKKSSDFQSALSGSSADPLFTAPRDLFAGWSFLEYSRAVGRYRWDAGASECYRISVSGGTVTANAVTNIDLTAIENAAALRAAEEAAEAASSQQ